MVGMEAQYEDEAREGPRHAVIMLGLFFLLLMAFGLSLSLGSVHIPLAALFGILTGGEVSSAAWAIIVHTIRLPKAITAVLAGAALSVSGLQMQTLFRNPLADPFVLGISAGASLGVAIVVLTVGSVGSVLIAGVGLDGGFEFGGCGYYGCCRRAGMRVAGVSQCTECDDVVDFGSDVWVCDRGFCQYF